MRTVTLLGLVLTLTNGCSSATPATAAAAPPDTTSGDSPVADVVAARSDIVTGLADGAGDDDGAAPEPTPDVTSDTLSLVDPRVAACTARPVVAGCNADRTAISAVLGYTPVAAEEGAFRCAAVPGDETACGADQVCDLGRCVLAGDVNGWSASDVWFVWSLDFGESETWRDFTGDGVGDNAFGDALSAAAQVEGSGTSGLLENYVKSAKMGEWVEYFATSVTPGQPPESALVFAERLAINPKNTPWPPLTLAEAPVAIREFVPGTALPRVRFGSVISADAPGHVDQMLLAVPIGTTMMMEVILRDVDLRFDAAPPDAASLTLTGLIYIDDLIDFTDSLLQNDCACLNLAGPVLARSVADPVALSPQPIDMSLADCPGMKANCVPFALIIASGVLEVFEADVDMNGDGAPDALSLTVRYNLTHIGSLRPPTPP